MKRAAELDIAWRVIDPASRDKDLGVYREELEVTGRIHRYLDDDAFRNIALGAKYFRLLDLEYEAPALCSE